MADQENESDQRRSIGGILWTDESEKNEGRPAWMWHTDDGVDCSNGIEDVADELVGISVAFGERADGKWGVALRLDHGGSRYNPDLTQEDAEQAAVALAIVIRGVWPS